MGGGLRNFCTAQDRPVLAPPFHTIFQLPNLTAPKIPLLCIGASLWPHAMNFARPESLPPSVFEPTPGPCHIFFNKISQRPFTQFWHRPRSPSSALTPPPGPMPSIYVGKLLFDCLREFQEGKIHIAAVHNSERPNIVDGIGAENINPLFSKFLKFILRQRFHNLLNPRCSCQTLNVCMSEFKQRQLALYFIYVVGCF